MALRWPIPPPNSTIARGSIGRPDSRWYDFFNELKQIFKITAPTPLSVSSTTYTVSEETFILADDDAAGAGITITIPLAANGPQVLYFKKLGTTGAITISRSGSDTIDGAASASLSSQWDSLVLASDGDTRWLSI